MEAVFGRDASSVFPNMNKDDDPMEALKASIGAKRFVSETEVGCGVAHGHSSSHGDRQAVKLHLTDLGTHCTVLCYCCCLQLEEIKKARGLSVDDGTAAADRPLAEILAERKKAKQDAFDDQWKQMKTGAHVR